MVKLSKSMKILSRTTQKGFTLIELLVVIGILGILAAALVATIDPFEQLKKADDSKIKNMAVEFQTANVRYFTTHSAFPWNDMATSNANALCQAVSTGGTAAVHSLLSVGGMYSNCIGSAAISNSLIGDGELKAGFNVNTNDLAKIQVNWDPANATNMIVCFSPTSKSQKASPETTWAATGITYAGAGSCPDANAPDGRCWWCTQ
jgi:prepilin-type N-terminal cleavage/methylation domain-containing protein